METAQECHDAQSVGEVGGDDPGQDPVRARFDALSHREQQEILNKYRDWSVQYDWWDSEYEYFQDRMKDLGIAVVTTYFSGFWSQGDGASFKGRIDDLALFIQKHNIVAPTILSLLSGDSIDAMFKSSVSGHYSHSGCMFFEHELQFTGPDYDEPLLQAAATVKNGLAEKEWDELTRNLAPDIFRGYADELYRDLEQEHEYLTSDEQVLELLISNELLEEEVERYEPDRTEEGDEGADSDALQELLLRPPGAVPDSSGTGGHPDAGD